MDTNTHATAYTTRMTTRNVDDVSSRVDEIMNKYWADKEASHNNREKHHAHNNREKQKKQKAILEAALGRVQLEGVSLSKELLENAEKALKDSVKQKALLASAVARVEELEGEASIEERHHAFIRAVIDRKDKEIAMLLSQNDDSQAEITKLRLLLS